jgi:hypothetical protein
MDLEVFDLKLGKGATVPYMTDDSRGLVAVKLLDAVQTIADVLTVNDGGKGWTVTFDPGINAYTDRGEARHIVVSGKPLFDAKPGTPLVDVAKVMSGFVVHEVGHTGLDFFTAVRDRWPGKTLPLTLANIIEDVVLELRTVDRYRGFADHGDGNIFRPTLEWVAEKTSPKTPLKWSGSTGHKVNVTGQIVRYRDFVSFDTDEVTQTHLRWVEDEWMPGITIDLTPEGCVALIERWLDHVMATKEQDEPTPEPPKPPTTDGGTGSDQTLPNEDEDEGKGSGEGGDTEGEDGDGEGNPGGGDTEGDDSDDEDSTEGGGDSESDDDGEDGTSGSEDGDEDGEGGQPGDDGDGTSRSGDGNDADTMNRVDAPKGANDGPGKGGSGQAVAEAADENEVLDDFEPDDLTDSFDETAKPEGQYEQRRLNEAEQMERVTTRVDAGAFGKMRVVFK